MPRVPKNNICKAITSIVRLTGLMLKKLDRVASQSR